jgi:DNA-binding response OmpR family regulator
VSKILVADDDRVVLFTLAEGLRKAGFDVIKARDGQQALALCRSEKPDLALLDIRMPGLDGLELARALRDETTVPFLFLSAYADDAMVKRAVEIGALGYMVKPLDVAAILPSLRAALARAQDIDGLQHALKSNRTIATAVGMLMASKDTDQSSALEHLRHKARKERRRMEDVARVLVEGERRKKT